jgi:hypothetical protein
MSSSVKTNMSAVTWLPHSFHALTQFQTARPSMRVHDVDVSKDIYGMPVSQQLFQQQQTSNMIDSQFLQIRNGVRGTGTGLVILNPNFDEIVIEIPVSKMPICGIQFEPWCAVPMHDTKIEFIATVCTVGQRDCAVVAAASASASAGTCSINSQTDSQIILSGETMSIISTNPIAYVTIKPTVPQLGLKMGIRQLLYESDAAILKANICMRNSMDKQGVYPVAPSLSTMPALSTDTKAPTRTGDAKDDAATIAACAGAAVAIEAFVKSLDKLAQSVQRLQDSFDRLLPSLPSLPSLSPTSSLPLSAAK